MDAEGDAGGLGASCSVLELDDEGIEGDDGIDGGGAGVEGELGLDGGVVQAAIVIAVATSRKRGIFARIIFSLRWSSQSVYA